jgi:transposase
MQVIKKLCPMLAAKMQALCKELEKAPDFIYVGDSALYANILSQSEHLSWITRVPETIKEARELVATSQEKINWTALDNGYAYYATTSNYKDVQQRWILFYSEAAYCREVATLEKKIKQEKEEQNKAWWHLSNRVFTCQSDALLAAKDLQKNLKYHTVTTDVVAIKKYKSRGRPTDGELPEIIGYQIQYEIILNESKVSSIRAQKGRFILATNQLDQSTLPCDEVLKEYKSQSGTERGFKFIKDDTFQVDSVFLKTPERIEALMMIMTLCLMVYGVSEYDLRQALQKNNETIPSQTKKPTNRPSLRWIYYLFRVVNELHIKINGNVKKIVVNVNGLLKRIISYFGKRAHIVYFNSG